MHFFPSTGEAGVAPPPMLAPQERIGSTVVLTYHREMTETLGFEGGALAGERDGMGGNPNLRPHTWVAVPRLCEKKWWEDDDKLMEELGEALAAGEAAKTDPLAETVEEAGREAGRHLPERDGESGS